MKVWTKVHIKDHNKQVDLIGTALTNYVYGNGPILDIYRKYKVSETDRKELDEYVVNRVSGLLMLYLARDNKRINDIVNKYNVKTRFNDECIPEIEGYIEK